MEFKRELLSYKARDLMITDFKVIQAHQSVIRAREVMRLQKRSGLLVTDDQGRVVGIVSMENLIRAQEEGFMQSSIEAIMSKEVLALGPDDDMLTILQYFQHHQYRHLPVVDQDKRPIGLLTTPCILKLLYRLMEDHKEYEEVQKEGEAFCIAFDVESGDFQNIGVASTALKNVLRDLGGIPASLIRRVGVVAYEGETNIVIHSFGGHMEALISPCCIKVIFHDGGPGIPDIEQAKKPGFTTAPEQVKEMGFGAGMGLHNMEKFSDSLTIESEAGASTRIEALFWIQEG